MRAACTLDSVICHYEFIAARNQESCPRPLFEYATAELLESRSYQGALDAVRDVVGACSYNTMSFYQSTTKALARKGVWADPDSESEECDSRFLDSFLAYGSLRSNDFDSPVKMFHVERLIGSIVGYVDDFRLFALSRISEPDLRRDINEYLVAHIESYLDLFTSSGVARQRYTSVTAKVIEVMRQKIDQIRSYSGSLDSTPINYRPDITDHRLLVKIR